MRWILCSILVVLVTSGRSSGQWDEIVAFAGRMPGDTDLVVVVDDAASMRVTPVGLSASEMLANSGLAPETIAAWDELAGLLRINRQAAFDRLLGRRVMFIANGIGTVDVSWTLISEVDTKTRMLVRARMKPVPRRRIAGRPIYTLEHGRFVLAIVSPPKLGGDRAFLLLAPNSDIELFEQQLDRLTDERAECVAPDDEGFAALGRLDAGGALVLWRTRTGLGDQMWDEARYLAASIDVKGDTIVASTRSSTGLVWGPDDCCDGYPMWSGEQADMLGQDALFVDIGLLGGGADPIVDWLGDIAAAGLRSWTGWAISRRRGCSTARSRSSGRTSVSVPL